MATANPEQSGAPPPPGGATSEESEDKDDLSANYECNICLDTAKEAVISMCGHLFCWPCLHQWLETRPNRQTCPVCKAGVSKDKVIPLYGRGGGDKQTDPRDKLPPRPPGQRPEPETQGPFSGFDFGGGAQMTFGIGAFPFTLFAHTFNLTDGRQAAPGPGPEQRAEERNLSQLFLAIGAICILWLLIA